MLRCHRYIGRPYPKGAQEAVGTKFNTYNVSISAKKLLWHVRSRLGTQNVDNRTRLCCHCKSNTQATRHYSGRDFNTLSQLQPIKTLHLIDGIAQWVTCTQEHKALYHISGSQHKPSQAVTWSGHHNDCSPSSLDKSAIFGCVADGRAYGPGTAFTEVWIHNAVGGLRGLANVS